MTHEELQVGRRQSGRTQVWAAKHLGISQPYLSQLERGDRPIPAALAIAAARLYRLPPSVLPMPPDSSRRPAATPDTLARKLGALGYPGFAHLRGIRDNPAAVVLDAIVQEELEVRLVEALPWVVLNHSNLDWHWLVRETKLRDAQNRLGFVVALACELAAGKGAGCSALARLVAVADALERVRLVREDTLCRASMPPAEREWLTVNRSALARHWNLLTGLTAQQLAYAE